MQSLSEAKIGQVVNVRAILTKDIIKERMLALGITKGSNIEVVRKGPRNNLTVFAIRGVMIALRQEESSLILVE